METCTQFLDRLWTTAPTDWSIGDQHKLLQLARALADQVRNASLPSYDNGDGEWHTR